MTDNSSVSIEQLNVIRAELPATACGDTADRLAVKFLLAFKLGPDTVRLHGILMALRQQRETYCSIMQAHIDITLCACSEELKLHNKFN